MTVADDHAADVTYEAWGQAAAIRDAAEREAAAIRQQASDQAAAIREAAERDAAELRAAVLSMSGDLGRVAAYVTETLAVPAMPATRPARPAASPVTLPAASPAEPPARPAKPAARPAKPAARPAKPAARPAKAAGPAKPIGKAAGRPRQYFAMRLSRLAVAAMVLFAVTAGSTEIALHGFSFFAFRAAGTGSTPDSGLKEDQGPGQPDAPGTHRHLTVPQHKPRKHHHHHPDAHKNK
jgi:hypothetical protein